VSVVFCEPSWRVDFDGGSPVHCARKRRQRQSQHAREKELQRNSPQPITILLAGVAQKFVTATCFAHGLIRDRGVEFSVSCSCATTAHPTSPICGPAMHPRAGLGARPRSPPRGSVFQRASETLPGYIKNLLQPPQVPKRKAPVAAILLRVLC
jgi:hypothetical protein